MLREFILVGIMTSASLWVSAQRPDRHADNWLFGSNASIFFPFGTEPGASALNNMSTQNASMTYSDEDGNLILYSNGSTVWNKSRNIIEGAENLVNAFDPNYPGLIVPIPGNDNQFYIFSVDDALGNNNPNTVTFPIYYSHIDLNANNGEGKKVGSTLPLYSGSSFGMTTVKHCNNIDYWLLIHEGEGNRFLSYLISKDGIDTENPVLSEFGFPFSGSSFGLQQEIIASENGKKIAVTIPAFPESGFIEIFDFDNITGEITKLVTSYKSLWKIKGAAFSPNGELIYVSRLIQEPQIVGTQIKYDYELVQFKTINAPAYREIITQRGYTGETQTGLGNFLLDPGSFGNLKLGPNGKIYLAHIDATALSVINEPNNEGLACDFDYFGLSLNNRKGKSQLPNIVSPDYPGIEALLVFTEDSLDCNPTLAVELEGLEENEANYQWYLNNDEIRGATNKTHKATESGQYKVLVGNECRQEASNTKVVNVTSNISPPKTDSIIQYCQKDKIEPLYADGEQIKWYSDAALNIKLKDGNTFSPPINNTAIGSRTYYVSQSIGNCESNGKPTTIEILDSEPIVLTDSLIFECFDSAPPISLNPTGINNSEVAWFHNGKLISNEKSIELKQYGEYTVSKINTICSSKDSITIKEGCFRFYLPTAFSPNGDGENETFTLSGNGAFEFDFSIIDRRGRAMIQVEKASFENNAISLWDGIYLNEPAPIGTYNYFFEARITEEGIERKEKRNGSIMLIR